MGGRSRWTTPIRRGIGATGNTCSGATLEASSNGGVNRRAEGGTDPLTVGTSSLTEFSETMNRRGGRIRGPRLSITPTEPSDIGLLHQRHSVGFQTAIGSGSTDGGSGCRRDLHALQNLDPTSMGIAPWWHGPNGERIRRRRLTNWPVDEELLGGRILYVVSLIRPRQLPSSQQITGDAFPVRTCCHSVRPNVENRHCGPGARGGHSRRSASKRS